MITEKICTRCKVVKPISEFYWIEKKQRYRCECDPCTKARQSAWYRDNREARILKEAERKSKPARKAQNVRYQLLHRKNNPEKQRARRAITYALSKGKIKRQPCEVCGAKKVQAHHDDYSKPLDVRWLCRVHHLEEHGKVAYAQNEEKSSDVNSVNWDHLLANAQTGGEGSHVNSQF